MEYKPVRSGRGGKVVAIDIYLQRNTNNKMYALAEEGEEIFKEEVPEPANMTELILDVIDYITDVKISSKEASILLKDADYQIDTVKKAYDLSRSQPEIKTLWMDAPVHQGRLSAFYRGRTAARKPPDRSRNCRKTLKPIRHLFLKKSGKRPNKRTTIPSSCNIWTVRAFLKISLILSTHRRNA